MSTALGLLSVDNSILLEKWIMPRLAEPVSAQVNAYCAVSRAFGTLAWLAFPVTALCQKMPGCLG
jgi:hypothetical protein